jgi:dipeptidyl aminopeptidase/acylaminoacyl peptidase
MQVCYFHHAFFIGGAIILRKSLPAFFVALIALFAASALSAQDAKSNKSAKKTPWTPQDIVFSESANQFRISPDGKWAVWVKSTGSKDRDHRASNLYLSSLTEKKEIEMTRGEDEVSNPRWSPSGDKIAFLSTRALPKPDPKSKPAKTQLWMMDAFGGEPWNVTSLGRDIHQFEWLDDDTILFSAEEDASLYEAETKKRKDDSRVIDDAAHTPPVRLFTLSLKNKKISRVTNNDDWIQFSQPSWDGQKVVAVARRELSYAWDEKTPPATYLIDLTTGKRTQILPGRNILPDRVAWARDNSGFYIIAPYSDSPRFYTASIQKIYYYDLVSGTSTEVNLDWERAAGYTIETTGDGFVALLKDGVYTKPARFTKHGSTWSREWITGATPRNYFDFVLGDDAHTLVYEYSTASTPTQWFRANLDGANITSPMQITDLNPTFKNHPIAKTEVIHWKGANDDEVEGLLFYPDDYQAGKKYPLVVATHGGPAGADHDSWSESWAYANELFTQRGAFVLKTNYHGSSDYGLKWVESICCGKYYTLEIPDIEKGVDSLIAKDLVDPNQIGALGWSNGSILSIQLTVTDPDRYKVASVGAGDVEWISDWANVDFGEAFDHYYFGKAPFQDPQLYIEKSPVFKLDRVKTPTLIFHGMNDRNVPTDQSWEYYRTLYWLNKVPVKFVLFPGEPHGPRKLSHQLRKLDEETAWFDKYLFHANPPENEAFKKGSPLDVAIRRESVKKSGADYGVMDDGALVPEVVKHGDIDIGRFEVTRAQFAAFDKNYKIDPGTGNYPANGITFEQAKAYCDWLSKKTGEAYRLPNEQEAESLYKPHASENTLDYWAGYSLNPEDAQRLDAKIQLLSGNAPLLREVGSFSPEGADGEPLVFDLDGNVAEWAVAADGTGKTLGGSADRPADPKARYRPADPAYTGFRVIRDASK